MGWRISRGEGEGRELARLVDTGTVLYLNSDWIGQFSLEVHPVDSTDKFHIFRNLELASGVGVETQGQGSNIGVEGIS